MKIAWIDRKSLNWWVYVHFQLNIVGPHLPMIVTKIQHSWKLRIVGTVERELVARANPIFEYEPEPVDIPAHYTVGKKKGINKSSIPRIEEKYILRCSNSCIGMCSNQIFVIYISSLRTDRLTPMSMEDNPLKWTMSNAR